VIRALWCGDDRARDVAEKDFDMEGRRVSKERNSRALFVPPISLLKPNGGPSWFKKLEEARHASETGWWELGLDEGPR